MAFISVIVPLYNKENYVAQAIKSVLSQAFTDFELLVIDDGSTDNSLAIAKGFVDKRLSVWSKQNKGVSATRNFGIERAGGELVAFLDADDYWENNHLEELMRLHEAFPQVGMYATRYGKVFSKRAEKAAVFKEIPPDFFGLIPDYFEASAIDSVAWSSSVAVARVIFEEVGRFDMAMKAGEDVDMWVRIALHTPVALSGRRTAHYRMNVKGSLSKTALPERMLWFLNFAEREKQHASLKKYLDLNRYALALDYKMAGNAKLAREAARGIHYRHLNYKQRLLLRMPGFFVRLLKKLQRWLATRGIFLSPYR